ncbi:DUF1343 domain-containing protein [Alteromonas sp. C1M14]|uniref:exo-beta-N-acetylmuramidase NamZ family protein n=1 Tax=Alteromonas sp. C1M14 TaxID=2841567 RepID=UPI001C08C308|nr:DUF1343 domain-containing protein [Alteromonas sp. C1M14]MBU2978715.1 DUF1343 domain-containing protein [Alteromonas sp. C1M14]
MRQIGSSALLLWLLILSTTFACRAVTLGAERTDAYLSLTKGKRIGLIVNQTSTVGDSHLVDYLLARNVDIRKVMAPEHGFRGDAGAGETITDGHDPKTGLPILSLYGKTKKPTADMLKDVDILIFDIQDVGARFYTYISTLHLVMEAAAEQGKPLIVLDRPNPNGRFVDGPVRENGFRSFVGMDPIPLLHGMTMAELALMIKGEGWISQAKALSLHVVTMMDYDKQQAYSLPVAPSPNLPNDQAIALYPSLCLFEGTTVSVGRGTPFPFQVLGHDKVKLGDFTFRPQSLPTSAPHPKLEGKQLAGMDLRRSSIAGFDLSLLLSAHAKFKKAGVLFIDRPAFFDKLAGTDKLRQAIEAGDSEAQIRQQWQPALIHFKRQQQPYLLY